MRIFPAGVINAPSRYVIADSVATFAEGLATRELFEMPLALFPHLVDEIVLVDDDQIADAIRLVLDTAQQVVEGAGAAMARRGERAGKAVGLVLSDGNITAEQLRRILDPRGS